MHISFYTHEGGLITSTGFGMAGFFIVRSLQELGHKVTFDDATAEVQLMFTQPSYYKDFDGLNIGLTPWESTQVFDSWVEPMKSVDQLWATSSVNKLWYENQGFAVDTVYPHGVDDSWTPWRRRVKKDRVKFLHIGEPAPRKCGQLAYDAFLDVCENTNHQLTIKSNGPSSIRYDRSGLFGPPTMKQNVRLIEETYTNDQMVSLIQNHDVLLYPSWGEGFGFIPIQALATGMPVIFNTSWAEYAHYSLGLSIEDRLVDSPWPHMHPGKMFEPSRESLKERIIEVIDSIDGYADEAYEQSAAVRSEFSWIKQTEESFRKVCASE